MKEKKAQSAVLRDKKSQLHNWIQNNILWWTSSYLLWRGMGNKLLDKIFCFPFPPFFCTSNGNLAS